LVVIWGLLGTTCARRVVGCVVGRVCVHDRRGPRKSVYQSVSTLTKVLALLGKGTVSVEAAWKFVRGGCGVTGVSVFGLLQGT
jgi:hypothetical protein